MVIEKGYLTKKNSITISKTRVIIGVLLALGVSFCLYALLCGLSMMFVLMENNYFNNGPIILTSYERYWQNFSFALIASIIGHSVFLITIFSRPLQFHFSNQKRAAIVNSQIFLGFNFFHLFFKLFFLIGLIVSGFLIFPELKGYSLVIYLAAIVLFLESWKVILRVFRKRAYGYMFISTLFILITAFLFSLTSVFDYKKTEALLLINNPVIDLPITDFETHYESGSFSPYLRVRVLKIIEVEREYQYLLDGQKYHTLKELFDKLYEEKINERHFFPPVTNLYAPFETKMSEINKVRMLLFEDNNSLRIKYITTKPGLSKNDIRGILKRDLFSEEKMTKFRSENQIPISDVEFPPYPINEIPENHLITIKISDGFYFINGENTGIENLIEAFYKQIDNKNLFHFTYTEEETTYQEYLTVYAAYRQAVDSLRQKEQKVALDMFRYENHEEYEQDQNRVMAIFPIRYVENDHREFIVK